MPRTKWLRSRSTPVELRLFPPPPLSTFSSPAVNAHARCNPHTLLLTRLHRFQMEQFTALYTLVALALLAVLPAPAVEAHALAARTDAHHGLAARSEHAEIARRATTTKSKKKCPNRAGTGVKASGRGSLPLARLTFRLTSPRPSSPPQRPRLQLYPLLPRCR